MENESSKWSPHDPSNNNIKKITRKIKSKRREIIKAVVGFIFIINDAFTRKLVVFHTPPPSSDGLKAAAIWRIS